jgi:hypothetical protein
VHICVYSYSTVDVIKQRNMVNSGVRGTKDKDLSDRGVLVNSSNTGIIPIYLSYHDTLQC